MTAEHKEINKQMAKGSAWMVLFKLFEKSISIVSTIIIARLLVPDDFGIVVIAIIIVEFLELLRAFGFDMALIQNQQATKEHYNTAWTFNVIAAAAIAALLVAFAPLISGFYEDDRLSAILPVLAAGVLISGLENIGVVAFRKELTFHKEFIYLLSRKAISFAATISLALYFRNYWAIIGGMVATHVGIVMLSYAIHNYRPRFCLSKAKELLNFSGWLLLNNLLTFVNYQAGRAILGKMVGTSTLGTYTLATEITKVASSEIVLPINRATFPGYSKLKDHYPALKTSFLNTLGLIAILIMPATIGLASVAPLLVPILLGEQWLAAIPIMQVTAISSLITALASIQMIYLALGKPRIMTIIMIIRVVIFLPAFILATLSHGIMGAVYSSLAVAIIMLPITFTPIIRVLNIGIIELINKFIRPLLASVTMWLILHTAAGEHGFLTTNTPTLPDLIMAVIIGAVAYTATLWALWAIYRFPQGGEQQILSTLKSWLQGYRHE